MTESGNADQTRKRLLDTAKGKAKEVLGALTGNDSLTAEGQLEQVQAHKRKEAGRTQALADAEAKQAREEATEAKIEGAAQRSAVNADAAQEETVISTEQAAQKRATEQAAHRDLAKDQAHAERDAHRDIDDAKAQERAVVSAADEEMTDALDDYQDAVRESAVARAEADRIRRQADGLSKDAELP